MTKKQFDRFLKRDGHCWHCGRMDDTLVAHHRRNRGMGGSPSRNTPANIIVVCSTINQLMEQNPEYERYALTYGWKLRAGQEPAETPVFDRYKNQWFFIDDDYNREARED